MSCDAKPGKGETRCNRTACQVNLPSGWRWWNTSTLAWYCASCAERINEASRLFREPVVCFKEGCVPANLPPGFGAPP